MVSFPLSGEISGHFDEPRPPISSDRSRAARARRAAGEQSLTTEELAIFLDMSSQVLKINRMTESGIPFIRLGGSIRYRLRDVEDHLAANTVRGSAKGVE